MALIKINNKVFDMENTEQALAVKLRELVEKTGMSQVKLAEHINVQPRTFRKWLSGEGVIPWSVALAIEETIKDIEDGRFEPPLKRC